MHPRVVSWTATDSSIHFNYNVFWPTSQVTVNYNSRATRNADLSLAYVTATPDTLTLNGVTVNDVTSFPFSSEVEINEGLMPCSPMSLTLQSVSVNGRVFKEQEYFAWTCKANWLFINLILLFSSFFINLNKYISNWRTFYTLHCTIFTVFFAWSASKSPISSPWKRLQTVWTNSKIVCVFEKYFSSVFMKSVDATAPKCATCFQ